MKSWEIDNRIYLGAGAAVLTLAGCAELGLYRWSSAWEWLRSARWEALLLFSGGTVLLLVAARHAGRPASEASATPVAATPSGHHDRWNSPSSLTAAVTAAAAIAALVFTGQQSRAARESVEATREQLRLTRLGQVRQRYSQAIDQLGAQGIDARTGGIYALERIMRESSTDQDIIVDILAAFVRNHRPLQSVIDSSIVPGDVQAALTVLGRRPTDYAIDGYPIPRWDPAGRTLNLSYTDLTGANLTRAKLAFADLTGSNLQGADLTLAQLTGAKLFKARLAKADLSGRVSSENDTANLGADLTRADLGDADLTGAAVGGARLSGALLDGVVGLECPAVRENRPCDWTTAELLVPRSAFSVVRGRVP